MSDRQYTISETDLGSRTSAARFRSVIERDLTEGSSVVIDLGAVISASDSWADELFGVLVARLGLERFIDRVKIRGGSPPVMRTIADVVRDRLNQGASTPDYALLAVKRLVESRGRATG
jgi:STAS-like domain of unknown function (DUF4325)